MTDITAGDGIEGWIKRTDRTLRGVTQAIGRMRVPRTCRSTGRPDPRRLEPGYPMFEMDTSRMIYVNAAQTDWVDALGVQADQGRPTTARLSGSITGAPTATTL